MAARTAPQQRGRVGIRAIGFDIDGTLYSNSAMYRASFGFALRHLRLFRAFRRVRQTMRATPYTGDFYSEQARRLAGLLNVGEAEARATIDRFIYGEWEQLLRRVPILPDVRTCLASIRARGWRVGVLSDFPVAGKLALLGLDNLFDCAVCSEHVGFLKPDARPFLELQRCLDTPPAEILFVGNSHKYDILGARAVGMRTAHFTRVGARRSVADVSFRRYRDLMQWLDTQTDRDSL